MTRTTDGKCNVLCDHLRIVDAVEQICTGRAKDLLTVRNKATGKNVHQLVANMRTHVRLTKRSVNKQRPSIDGRQTATLTLY
jgi:hypothetical protein